MTKRNSMIRGGVFGISLLLAPSIFSAALGKLRNEKLAGQVHTSYSTLARDQELLAADMRKLRRDLRRGASQLRIFQERSMVRRDWLNIVADRGLERAEASPTLVNLGP
jgi:hypothetical protein